MVLLWRRRRDLNPRDTFAPYSLSRGAPSPLGYFSKGCCLSKKMWRRGWDSNPRALSDKRFSRPPRYDRFDTSPCVNSNLGTPEIFSVFVCQLCVFVSLAQRHLLLYQQYFRMSTTFFNFFYIFFYFFFLFAVFPHFAIHTFIFIYYK